MDGFSRLYESLARLKREQIERARREPPEPRPPGARPSFFDVVNEGPLRCFGTFQGVPVFGRDVPLVDENGARSDGD